MNRTARLLLSVGIALCVLTVLAVVLFHPVENWRGKRAWENCQRELAAKGESLDWKTFIPPPVPDEQNFFKAPHMTEWFVGRGTNELAVRLASDNRLESYSRRRNASSNDVVVAEFIFATGTNSDFSRFDAVLHRIDGGRFVLAQPPLPTSNSIAWIAPGWQTNVIPLIVMDDVPLVDAIQNLARGAQSDSSIAPEIHFAPPDLKAQLAPYLVSVSWEDIPAKTALMDLLNHYGLQCIEVSKTRGIRITRKNPAVAPTCGYPDLTTQMAELIRRALGKSAKAARGFTLIPAAPDHIKPIRILLSGPSSESPTVTEITGLFSTNTTVSTDSDWIRPRIERVDDHSFRATMTRKQLCTAEDYLAWSDQFQADFLAIHNALQRPYARMDGDYEKPYDVPVPNFITLRNAAQILSQRAQCYLLLEQPEKALNELTQLHELSRILEGKPTGRPMTLVALMINVAIVGLHAETVADGLRWNTWREPQLIALQEQFEQIELLPMLAESLRGERTGLCRTFQITRAAAAKNKSDNSGTDGRQPGDRFDPRQLMPRGWFDQNLATIALLGQRSIESLDITNRIILVQRANAWTKECNRVGDHFRPYSWMAAIAIPNYSKAFETLGKNQTRADEALITCALERYRMAHGQYPETLADLAPQYLKTIPRDIINGQPLKYHHTSNDQFTVYSVGWNETDDGGCTALIPSGSGKPGKADWVWASAAN